MTTPLEFLQRVTAAERAATRAAAAANPELADWIDQARFAPEINRDAVHTAAAVDALVGAGILPVERRGQCWFEPLPILWSEISIYAIAKSLAARLVIVAMIGAQPGLGPSASRRTRAAASVKSEKRN